MRLTLRVLGLEVLDVELSTDDQDEDDKARDLSGGLLGSERIEVDTGDRYMGFTNGRGIDDDRCR